MPADLTPPAAGTDQARAHVVRARVLDYDHDTSAAIIAALATCPPAQRLDSLAAATKVYVEGHIDARYPQAVGR